MPRGTPKQAKHIVEQECQHCNGQGVVYIDISQVGGRIKYIRMQKGMTAMEVANLSGVAHTTISYIERGKRAANRATTLQAIAKSLGVTTSFLLGETNL